MKNLWLALLLSVPFTLLAQNKTKHKSETQSEEAQKPFTEK